MTDLNDDIDEKPLDPAMERVRRKLARLMVVSIGIMLVGLMAVLGAVVYKSGGGSSSAETARATLQLPDGFVVSDTAYGDGRVLFYGVAAGDDRRVLIFDAETGRLVADHSVR
ncbi:DUF6476 family protein [Oricola sp.]|uniref:DUF6476 family protein n=1 Tax=Oricola sp. TaxID=1979950 RepID=UPI0025EA32EF|nr:DUF6476 family protein [Oricola sp.]MCI5074588.1 DUF6476 family protein [Oricola sp.]